MALNHTVAHTEDPRLPGFTALGERAASHSMLTGGGAWSAGVTFRQAPNGRSPPARARTRCA
jgi:hypothetical protein